MNRSVHKPPITLEIRSLLSTHDGLREHLQPEEIVKLREERERLVHIAPTRLLHFDAVQDLARSTKFLEQHPLRRLRDLLLPVHRGGKWA